MSAVDDAGQHVARLRKRFGDQDLPDIGGFSPEVHLEQLRKQLLDVRRDEGVQRRHGVLGWYILLLEELLEVATAKTDEERYNELIDLAGGALAYAEVVKLRNSGT